MRSATRVAALLACFVPGLLAAQGAPATDARAPSATHATRRGDSLVVHYAGSLLGAQALVLERRGADGTWRTVGDTARPPRTPDELRSRMGAGFDYLARLFDAENPRLLWLRINSDPFVAGIAALLDADIGPALGRRLADPRFDAVARYRTRVIGGDARAADVTPPRTAERLLPTIAPRATHVPTALAVSWRHPAGSDALAYHLEGRSSDDTTWRRLSTRPIALSGRGDSVATVVTLVREGVVWHFAVRPVGAGGKAGPLSPITRYEAFDRTPPQPVLDPAGTVDSTNVPTLRWSAAPEPDAAGYIVYRSRDGKKRGARVNTARIPVERLVWSDSSLEESGPYIYRLSVVDSAGNESEPGNAAPVRVPDRTPPALRGALVVTILGDSAVRLRWAPALARDLREYVVTRQRGDKRAGDAWVRLNKPLNRDSTFTDRGGAVGGLRGIRVLKYRVVALDSSGNASAALEATVAIPDLVAPAAARFLNADRAPGRAVISWGVSPSDDVARYELRRATAAGDSLLAVIPDGTRSAYDDFTAGAGERRYRIIARDSAGNASTALSATLAADPGPLLAAPANVMAFAGSVVGVAAAGVAVRWDPVESAATYRVERAERLNGDFVVVGTTTSRMTAFTDATGRLGAWYRVRALDTSRRAGEPSVAAQAARR